MKKKIISSIMVLIMTASQFSQVSGAGVLESSGNAALYSKSEAQKAWEADREKEAKELQEKQELEAELQRLLEEERHYSDRFLVKYADKRSRRASEDCAKAAFAEAKEQKDAQEKAAASKIADAGERQEFLQELKEGQNMRPGRRTKASIYSRIMW